MQEEISGAHQYRLICRREYPLFGLAERDGVLKAGVAVNEITAWLSDENAVMKCGSKRGTSTEIEYICLRNKASKLKEIFSAATNLLLKVSPRPPSMIYSI